MSEPLRMIELHLDVAQLIRFAQDQDINQSRDEDLGYATHAWLAATFGGLVPKPYRLFQTRSGLRLLGYTSQEASALKEHAQTFALPLTLSVCNLTELDQAKEMPCQWRTGRRLGFEVLVCPVTRHERQEKDVFLRRVEAAGPFESLQRASVYASWLAEQLRPAIRLESVRLRGFRLVRMMRRTQCADQQPRRTVPRITRPQALLSGELTVLNGEVFTATLARGVGRHRTFGYGMLLLKPAQ